MTDSDDNPRFVLTARMMFSSREEAQAVAERIETLTGATLATEHIIEEV